LLATPLIAVLPMAIITTLLAQVGAVVYQRLASGELEVGAYSLQFREMRPASVQGQSQRAGLGDLPGLRGPLSGFGLPGNLFPASKAFSFGQGTFEFLIVFAVMLYLLFFLIRDGRQLVAKMREAIPLEDEQKRRLFSKFTRVVRATVKGNVVVAVTQGALGGLIFWFLGIPSVLLR